MHSTKDQDHQIQELPSYSVYSKSIEGSVNKPHWLKSQIPSGDHYASLKKELRSRGLFTVCEEAKCPNLSQCWEARTATIMILGDTCTRACKFCHVKTGNPKGLLNPQEIENTAQMVQLMNLRYVVITSVDRDDLPDGGASHFAQTIQRVKEVCPETAIEVLIPDFKGDEAAMHLLAQSGPLVIAQNLETVQRLTHPVRDVRAGYQQTLNCLQFYKTHYPQLKTKSSLMVGLGESMNELKQAMEDLRQHGVDIITFGQYLRPTRWHLPVMKYYEVSAFEELKEMALSLGFEFAASGPMVRSSYKAADYLDHLAKHATR